MNNPERKIRPITDRELDAFVTISANAYPGINLHKKAERLSFRNRLQRLIAEPAVILAGVFEAGEMVGVMRLYDFQMRILSTMALVGGIGGIGVDLLHKKKRVAFDTMQYFLNHYHQRGACMAALYPFRPDFYRRMGFGYGAKMHTYHVKPADLPHEASALPIAFLTHNDRRELDDCYTRFLMRNNGLMARMAVFWDEAFGSAAIQIVGVKRNGCITGYIIFQFMPGNGDNFLQTDILVRELVYDSTPDLRSLLTFLHKQADQIDRVLFNTQDEFFHYLMRDPRNGSDQLLPRTLFHESNVQGVGIMYRVIDVRRLFAVLADHNFNDASCCLNITLSDSFFPSNAGSVVVAFVNGRCSLPTDTAYDVEIQLDVSEFSSLLMGAVSFQALTTYGLATVSDPSYVNVVNRLFAAPTPYCLTNF